MSRTIVATVRLPAEHVEIVMPVLVGQSNCEAALGLSPRRFLDLAATYAQCGGKVAVVGKARLVEAAPFAAWLMTQTLARKIGHLDGAAGVLAEVGLRAVGGAR